MSGRASLLKSATAIARQATLTGCVARKFSVESTPAPIIVQTTSVPVLAFCRRMSWRVSALKSPTPTMRHAGVLGRTRTAFAPARALPIVLTTAVLLFTLPQALLTRTQKSSVEGRPAGSVLPVPPSTGREVSPLPPKYHWYCRAVPVAETESVVIEPRLTVAESGWPPIAGGGQTWPETVTVA